MKIFLAGVGLVVAWICGALILRAAGRMFFGSSRMTDEERDAVAASDARQAQFKKTGTYFPPDVK